MLYITYISENNGNLFHTTHGRIVKDGGGIEPYILVPPITYSPSESRLISQGIFYDFAKKYYTIH